MMMYENEVRVTKSESTIIDRLVEIYQSQYGYEPVFRKTKGGQFFIYKTEDDAKVNRFVTVLSNVYAVEAWLGGAIMSKSGLL